jgi:5-formaminoimidazole-4-carboxamide-1-(beta)-D-ribofuranosyl 5'-monophosphate synthetase
MEIMMEYSIATFGSHSALQILKGAQQEGFKTICICLRGNERPYQSFRVADKIILVDSYDDFFTIEQQLIDQQAILIPHASMIAHFGIAKINAITMHYFGDKAILNVEANRSQQEQWLAAARLKVPRTFSCPEDIDRLCIIKFYGAQGGSGYFLAKNSQEFYKKMNNQVGTKYQIQEYIIGVPTYIHYFYSPLTHELELFGFDRRYESNVDGIGRIAANDQAHCNLSTSYTVAGNTPLVIRESLLPTIFTMGESVVQESKKLTRHGLYGAFCLETVVTSDLHLYVFEISARIVAGTNVSVEGSPYSYLRYDEPMSTGRRIAREIKQAIAHNRLSEILG